MELGKCVPRPRCVFATAREDGLKRRVGYLRSIFLLRALCTSRLAPHPSDMEFYGTADTSYQYIIPLPLLCVFVRRVLERVTDSHLDSNKSVGPDLPRETTDQMRPCAHHAGQLAETKSSCIEH